jgi:trans-AT polyketide synthase/acyltransferase/oxidoreductase domain-containing protein
LESDSCGEGNIKEDTSPLQYAEKSNSKGWWVKGETAPETGVKAIRDAIHQVNRPVVLVDVDGEIAVARGGNLCIGAKQPDGSQIYPLLAHAPSLCPGDLGDPIFKQRHGLKYAYIAGAMANGITSVEMVEAMGNAGMIGFFGAAGLSLDQIENGVQELQQRLGSRPFGSNLIFSPNDPELEAATVDLYLRRKVRLISASAFMTMTPSLVRFRVAGIHRDPSGKIVCPNRIIAKVSRVEVAKIFFSPPGKRLLAQLVEKRAITNEEAELAAQVPMADDLTAEADSGGHTDNRPALALLPTMIALRDEMMEKNRYPEPIHVGLGGGIATPESTAAAFAMGAAYVLTGSANQACVEAGTSEEVRRMLAEAMQPDVTMAPSADMFELGVKVQVLKRGTMFALRAAKLYDLYSRYESLEEIPPNDQTMLQRDIFRCSFEQEWEQTKAFFSRIEPGQIERAKKDPKHKMALIFRSYLGRSSGWATKGEKSRKIDYQIWCGPAMGAFNEWAKGSFLEKPEERKTVTVAMNLLTGAAVVTRANWLRYQGVALPIGANTFLPIPPSRIKELLDHRHEIG